MEWEERVKNCETLDALREFVESCEMDLKANATQTVFADGNPTSKIMFIGEAPGKDEDEQGKPFVGKSGRWLNSMLDSIGLAREEVYITNAVLWFPPRRTDPWDPNKKTRKPTKEAIKACLPILHRHVELVAPEILVCLGRTGANALLNCDTGILTLRGEWGEYTMGNGKVVPVMPTPHPSYFLRQPHEQALAQNDFNLIEEKIRELNLTQ